MITTLSDRLVARNFLALGSGEAVARLIAFAATIYVARTLGSAAFGIIGFAAGIVLYLRYLADGGLELGLGVQLIAKDPTRIQTVVPALFGARLLVSGVLASLLATLGLLFLPQPEGAVFAAYGLTLLAVGAGSRWVHLGLEKTRIAAAARAAGELSMLLLIVWLVRGPRGIVLVPVSQFVGDTLTALLLFAWLRHWGHPILPTLDWHTLRGVIPRAWPLVASSLLGLMIYNSDLIFLRVFRDFSTVGLYVAAYALISFLGNLSAAYAMNLLPTLTRLGRSPPEQHSLYHWAMAQVFAVALPITVGGLVLAPEIMRAIFGEAYAAAALPLQILIVTVSVGVLRDVAWAGLLTQGREDQILRMNAAATVINLVANLMLVAPFGMVGAASATLITEMFRLSLANRFARQAGFQRAPLSRFWKPVPAALLMGMILFVSGPDALWLAIPVGGTLYLSVLALLGGIRFERGALPSLGV